MALAARTGAWSKSGSGVELVDYIQSDGSAWIDTGFKVTDMATSVNIVMSAKNTPFSWNHFFWGAGNANTAYYGPSFSMPGPDNLGNVIVSFIVGNARMNQKNYDAANLLFDGDFHEVVASSGGYRISFGQSNISVDGVNVISKFASRDGTDLLPDETIAIFGRHNGSGCDFKMPTQRDFKFRSIEFIVGNEIQARFHAAKLGDAYGIVNQITGGFISGIDGTITGGGIFS